MSNRYDVLVLGAGIVGVSTALHLLKRGQRVCLVDRANPGMGTSYGNAGLIERSAVIPYAFPHSIKSVFRYILNKQPDVYYHPGALLRMSGWLCRFWLNSTSKKLERAAQDMLPLIERCIIEHDLLIREAGLESLVRKEGWIDVYRSRSAFSAAVKTAQALQKYKLNYTVLDAEALRVCEPSVLPAVVGGIHWNDPWTLANPKALVQGYAKLFTQKGGIIVRGDAQTLSDKNNYWSIISADNDEYEGCHTVIALGPDANSVLASFGYKFPLLQKRGYHLHYKSQNHELIHPICDSLGGYVLTPMHQGIRLTTGIEFARADAPVDLTQIERAYELARMIFPIDEPVESEPWLGRRPCLPDMRPIIGPAPNHKTLWLNFGHNHHGVTLGPISGRLLAEMIVKSRTCVNPTPYLASRF